jgi:hypothetical protein
VELWLVGGWLVGWVWYARGMPQIGALERNSMESTAVKTDTVWVTQTGNSWGTSGDIYSTSTDEWSDADWAEFEEAPNDEKWEVFRYLARKYETVVTTFTP